MYRPPRESIYNVAPSQPFDSALLNCSYSHSCARLLAWNDGASAHSQAVVEPFPQAFALPCFSHASLAVSA